MMMMMCKRRMIPSDVITQILYRLPSKSIGRFRCVSKSWLALLTQPEFIKTHQKTLNRNHHIFGNYDSFTYCSFLYSHPFHHHDPYILNPTKLPIEFTSHPTFRGSCDGLVLVSYDNDDRCIDYIHTLVVLNPTTMESVQLPQFGGYYPHPRNEESVQIVCTHGFGYDSVTDDYKVITLTYFRYYVLDHYSGQGRVTCTTLRLSIYSLRSKAWRQQIIDSTNFDCGFPRHAVYVNGFLHWFGRKLDAEQDVIVAFSLADESFSEVPSPNLCNGTQNMSQSCDFVVLGGKLAIYVHYYSKWSRGNFEVWLMNEYGVKESWTKIPLDVFDFDFRLVKYTVFDDDGKIRVASKGQILTYDYENMCFTSNYVLSWIFGVFGSYVESLVSPKPKDRTNSKEIIYSSTKSQIVGSKARKVALRFAKILNDRKASLRKKRVEGKAIVKNKRKKVQKSKKYTLVVEKDGLTNDDVSPDNSSAGNKESGKDFEIRKSLGGSFANHLDRKPIHQGNITFQDFSHDINQ